MSDADFTRRMRAQMRDPVPPPPTELDFIKRLADAWDGRGNDVFTAAQIRALWTLAYLDPDELYDNMRWSEVPPAWRAKLVTAARAAIVFGQVCRDIFG